MTDAVLTDAELIAHHGGPTKLAKRLKWDIHGGQRRIQNWITRGIPTAIKKKHPRLFSGRLPATPQS